jgi:hypothetical protein
VLGQILPRIPVRPRGPEARFSGMPIVVFPRNVGAADALWVIADGLRQR